jgi:hypothetical protein
MAGRKSFMASIEDGTAEAEGNVDILSEIASTLVTFQIGFEVLPGTARPATTSDLNPYAVQDEAIYIRGE